MFKWEGRKKKKHKNSSNQNLFEDYRESRQGRRRGVWTDNGGAELSDGFLWISSKLRCSATVSANPHTLLVQARALRHITADEPRRAELMGYSGKRPDNLTREGGIKSLT